MSDAVPEISMSRRIFKSIKRILYYGLVATLTLILVVSLIPWFLPAPTLEITHKMYSNIKPLIITKCPNMNKKVFEFVANDGIMDYNEYRIFYNACTRLYIINNWKPIKKQPKQMLM